MEYFNKDNCDYNDAQRQWANDYVANWLAQRTDPDDYDNIKNACDAANDAMPCDA